MPKINTVKKGKRIRGELYSGEDVESSILSRHATFQSQYPHDLRVCEIIYSYYDKAHQKIQEPKSIIYFFEQVNLKRTQLYQFSSLTHNLIYQYLQSLIQGMKVNKASPLPTSQRAKRLGLTSHRFYERQISRHAKQAIEYIKKKDRSNLDIDEWRNKKYYKTDAIKQLFDCPQDIQRRNIETLTVEEFIEQYEKPNKAVIIKGCTEGWNLGQKWTHQYFYRNYKDFKFKVGEDDQGCKLRIQFKYYLEYLLYNKDDSPLYLFESSLEDKQETRKIMNNYTIPPYFNDDLFKHAGEKKRPPYRWFIMGPERSGTTVHIDPLMTSAWNASVVGHKRWVLFSSEVPKSIVKGKEFRGKNYEDEAINYFVEILPKIKEKYTRQQLKITQFIQRPGQIVFVPGGLWHAVINLNDTIAVTQNVMTHFCFDRAWKSTRCERRKFAKMFLAKLQKNDLDLYNRAIKLNEEDKFQMGDKYCAQEVSLSFTPSSSSSSSSSSQSQSSFKRNRSPSSVRAKEQKNKVETKKRRGMSRSHSHSRSRDKKRRSAYSQEKVSTNSKKSYDQ